MSNPSTKRAWKLHEFVAHGSNVNCVALGHKTGRVMVTGGDDRKVNLWTVGKPNCVMSLSGHTSPVEAVRFGNAEEMVVAGSMSGALKIWDLEQAKIIRTLTGHKANIRCLDFHPYGDFVASGSLDTNVKLWDIRRKGCIFTYKGHSNGVNCLRFSPDGRWVASAAEDSVVKIWDLAAGKLLTDLKQHSAAVNCIEFHPSEYLLASGSSDRSIKFWELERFQCVDSTDFDNNAIRSVLFHPDGACIFGGSSDLLKVYSWEPSKCFDSINMSWGKVVDVAMAQSQLIGASINQTNVSTFVLDLTRVAPFGEVPGTPTPPLSSSGRKNYKHDRPPTSSTKQQLPNSTTSNHSSSNSHISRQVASLINTGGRACSPVSPSASCDGIIDCCSSSPIISTRSSSPASTNKRRSLSRNSDSDYMVKQTKSSALRRSCSLMVNSPVASNPPSSPKKVKPVTRSASVLQAAKHLSRPSSNQNIDIIDVTNNNRASRNNLNKNGHMKQRDIPVTILTNKPAEEPEEPQAINDDAGDDASSTADVKDPKEYEQVFKPKSKLAMSPPKHMDPFPAPKDDDINKVAADLKAAQPFKEPHPAASRAGGETYRRSPAPFEAPPYQPNNQYQPSPSNHNPPSALDPKDFMPTQNNTPQPLNDYDALSQISKGHGSMSALLSARNKNLQIVRAMWSSGNIRTALESAIQMKDDSVIVDILNVLNDKPRDWSLDVVELLLWPICKLLKSKFEAQLWSLDVAATLLVHIKKLIVSKYESHVLTSCASLKLVLKTFSPLIRQNLLPPDRLGVDISAEERHRKCMNIYSLIQDIRLSIEGKHYQSGKLGGTFKEIKLLLDHLDT